MNRSVRQFAIVAAVAILMLFTNLGGPRLWDRDEPRNASCAAEMLERNDWVTPVMNAELRTHKPVMLYWATMGAYAAGGVNEFTARFASALAGVGSVLLTYAIGRRIFNDNAAFWGAIALATMMMFNVAGRAATPDSLLIFFITATLAVFVYAFDWRGDSPNPVERKLSLAPAALLYFFAACAVLTKGPVGVLLPLAIAGVYLMSAGYDLPTMQERSLATFARLAGAAVWRTPKRFWLSFWQLRPILGTAIILAVAGPWYLWVGLRTNGEWPSGFFFSHNLGRFQGSMEGHGGSIFYYPVALLLGASPWSVLLGPACLLLWQKWPEKERRGLTLCGCWGGVIVGLFSLAQTKLPSYITPCYPAIGLVVGWFLSHLAESATAPAPQWKAVRKWTIAAGAVLIVAGVSTAIGLPIAASIFTPGELWMGALGLAPLFGGVGLIYCVKKRVEWSPAALAISASALVLGAFALAADRIDLYRRHEELFTAIDAENKSVPVAAWGVLEPSWVFYSRRPLEVVETKPTSLRVVPSAVDGKWKSEQVDTPSGFLERNPDGVLVTTRSQWERARQEWDDKLVEVASAPYFLKKDDLVALRTRESVAMSKSKNVQR